MSEMRDRKVAFGQSLSSATTALFGSLAIPFEEHRKRFIEQWERPASHRRPLEKFSGDSGHLYHGSYSLLLAHEDKTYPGAFIASLSIPWGESRGDNDEGGYHYVWTRDMVNTATGLLAGGNTVAPLRALIYLLTVQRDDGRFPQNFWIDGSPYWGGIQLDEVALPILLAWRLYRLGALANFDPYHLIKRGAAYLVKYGPATAQERWEDSSGYSPSTTDAPLKMPAKRVVDAGFLELVRYGVMRPDDPLILDSIRVVDSVLKVDTPFGPCWRRYNHDGYGQRDDGGPYQGGSYRRDIEIWKPNRQVSHIGRGMVLRIQTPDRFQAALVAGRMAHRHGLQFDCHRSRDILF